MIKISVIIPFYNVECYVVQCLDSVVRQTLDEIEILCIDDKSPDSSLDIIKEFAQKDDRIRIYRHDKNRGLGAARNTGIANATGEYIFFLDSDDWLLEDGLEKLYDAAKKHGVKVVSAPFKRYVEASDSYKRTRIKARGEFRLTDKNFASLEYNVFKLYHKSIFEDENIRFPGRLIHEDVEFYWKIFTMHNCIYCVDHPVMVYRIRASSIMNSKKADNYCNNNIELVKNIFLFLEKNNILATYRKSFTKEFYHFYYMGSTFDAEKFSQELEPFFHSKNFKLGFSMRRIRKWFYNKKFNKNETTLRFLGIYFVKKKL